jgi:hypothetical protein
MAPQGGAVGAKFKAAPEMAIAKPDLRLSI